MDQWPGFPVEIPEDSVKIATSEEIGCLIGEEPITFNSEDFGGASDGSEPIKNGDLSGKEPITLNSEDFGAASDEIEIEEFGDNSIPTRFKKKLATLKGVVRRKVFLTMKTMRRILSSKETIHKYGVFVPRNDKEAHASPEAKRWSSGRDLEWIRLQAQGTFERNWDWLRLKKAYPTYRKQDVGHVFFVYITIINIPGSTVCDWCLMVRNRIPKRIPRPTSRQLVANQFDCSISFLLRTPGKSHNSMCPRHSSNRRSIVFCSSIHPTISRSSLGSY
jgi:hypothetical protein